LRLESVLKVVPLEQARDGDRPRQADDFRKLELSQPLAVGTHFQPRRIGVDDLSRLVEVRLRVPIDLLLGQDRPLGRAPGRISDSRRVVADDEDALMAGALERGHPLERNRMPYVDIGRRDVDAELDAERPPARKLPLELPLGEHVHRVACEAGRRRRRHRGPILWTG
jgi:hypothetical protein